MDFSWIREKRKKRGLRTRDADGMGMTHGQISRIETGKDAVTFGYLVRIARWFEMGPEEVFFHSHAPYTPAICPTDELGAVIRSRRKAKHISLGDLGKMVGFTHAGIIKIENGVPKKLKVELIAALDQALGFDGELVGMAWSLAVGGIARGDVTGR